MNEIPGFTLDDVRREASEILLAIDASRNEQHIFEDNWRRLWQLLREVNAAYLPVDGNGGPWRIVSDPNRRDAFAPMLAADSFVVPVWPARFNHSEQGLPALLNWARVPAPPWTIGV